MMQWRMMTRRNCGDDASKSPEGNTTNAGARKAAPAGNRHEAAFYHFWHIFGLRKRSMSAFNGEESPEEGEWCSEAYLQSPDADLCVGAQVTVGTL